MTVWSSFAAGVRKIAEQRGLDPVAVLEPWTLGLADLYNGKPAGAMAAAIAHFARVQRAYDAFFERYDLVLAPTLAAPPVRIGE
jgi:amidase